jgi:sarcosine oxidase
MAAFDVIVIGLGAMGSAAADALARQGLDVLGIDRFGPGHALGSSHGRSRAIRYAAHEDPDYVPLLRRAYQLWRDLERRAREPILTVTGALDLGRNTGSDLVEGTLRSARAFNLMHEALDRDEILRRFPMFDIPNSYCGIWQPDGGFLRPEAALRAYQRLAGEAGARLHFGERVVGIEPQADRIEVVTDESRYECGQVLVAAGAWVSKLVPDLMGIARPTRQVTGWFWPRDAHTFALGQLPVFAVDDGVMGTFHGIPAFEPGGVKIARHGHLGELIDPDGLRLPVNDRDIVILRSFLARRLPHLDGEPLRTEGCVYTNLPDNHFLVDWLPNDSRILVASVCSGHGFKFASVMGEIIGELLVSGQTQHNISRFAFARLQPRTIRRSS